LKALITGITGQDGAYLAKLLLDKGYEVHGIKRRASTINTQRIDYLFHDIHETGLPFYLHYGDLTDTTSLTRVIQEVQPDEIYNLAAQSHVRVSFEIPGYTADTNGFGVLKLLETIRLLKLDCRFYQASTSELFGKVQEIPQRETTPFYPRSPYAIAKQFAFWTVKNYRESYGLHTSNGILFNHESPLRGETFITKKVTKAVAAIEHGNLDRIYLGNLDALRDWGHAEDYVEAMWLMLQQETPDDYVIATGVQHSVRELVELAFSCIDLRIRWEGEGLNEKGIDQNGIIRVEVDPRYYRPTEVDSLLGDASKAKQVLGWEARRGFKELVSEMVTYDLSQDQRRH